jgi:predicted permease
VALAAGLLLVITCVNVANLLVIRALGQARELVVRAALGATRAQLVTQQLIESALLCCLGGALGVALARLAVVVFVGLAPASLPRLEEIRVGGIALLGAVLITALAMVLSSIGPTIFASHTDADEVLRSGARHTVGTRTRWVGDGLVTIQVALAAMSLSGAVVMTRSLVKLWRADLSFDAQRMVVAELAVQPNRFASQEAAFTALDLVRTGLEAIPGVTAVSPVVSVPFVGAGGGIDGALALPGQSSIEAARNPVLNLEVVAPNYFAALGIPIQGRSFDDNDRAAHPPVVILSRGAAHALWPNENPIGKRVAVPGGGEATVVGLVPETRYRELERARPSAYFPFGNGPLGSIFPTTLLIRTSVLPATLVPALRRAEVLATHGLAMVSATPLETLLEGPRAEPRFRTFIILVFATSAVVLAAIGLFTVIGTRVRQRHQELAIRMVLGATGRDVGALVMARGLAVAVVGTAVGMIGALATSRLLSGLLFEVAPADGVTFALVAVVMLIVAAAASYVPARIGMKIRPATVLQ